MESRCIQWEGPFDWPQPRSDKFLDGKSGVYLWALESPAGWVVIGCGISKHVRTRFLDHRRRFLRGEYVLFDLEQAQRGIRKELWHGLWSPYNTPEVKAELQVRRLEIRRWAEEQILATKIFLFESSDVRLQQRVEAALLRVRLAAPKPYCSFPDKGMFVVGRKDHENPVLIRDMSGTKFCNVASEFEA